MIFMEIKLLPRSKVIIVDQHYQGILVKPCQLSTVINLMTMTLNPNYDDIGKNFVNQYYVMFDDPNLRANILPLYSETNSLMTFEGEQLLGRVKIMEKLQSLTFRTIKHVPTTIDCQPTFDGGVLVVVLGQLKTDEDPPHTFNQVFVLKPIGDTFYVEHDIFKLALHM